MLKLFPIGANCITFDFPTKRTDVHTLRTAGPQIILDILNFFRIENCTTVSHGGGALQAIRLFGLIEQANQSKQVNYLGDTHVLYNPEFSNDMDSNFMMDFFRSRKNTQWWILWNEDGIHSKFKPGNYKKTTQQVGRTLAKLAILRNKGKLKQAHDPIISSEITQQHITVEMVEGRRFIHQSAKWIDSLLRYGSRKSTYVTEDITNGILVPDAQPVSLLEAHKYVTDSDMDSAYALEDSDFATSQETSPAHSPGRSMPSSPKAKGSKPKSGAKTPLADEAPKEMLPAIEETDVLKEEESSESAKEDDDLGFTGTQSGERPIISGSAWLSMPEEDKITHLAKEISKQEFAAEMDRKNKIAKARSRMDHVEHQKQVGKKLASGADDTEGYAEAMTRSKRELKVSEEEQLRLALEISLKEVHPAMLQPRDVTDQERNLDKQVAEAMRLSMETKKTDKTNRLEKYGIYEDSDGD